MNIKKIIFKQAARAITDAKYTGMGVHDGNARIQYYHLEWMMNRIEELEQQLAQAHREGWEQGKAEAVALADKLTYEFTNDSAFNRGYLRASTECMDQIAAMGYKERTNG